MIQICKIQSETTDANANHSHNNNTITTTTTTTTNNNNTNNNDDTNDNNKQTTSNNTLKMQNTKQNHRSLHDSRRARRSQQINTGVRITRRLYIYIYIS